MTRQPYATPIRPERIRPAIHLQRAAYASALRAANPSHPNVEDILREIYGDDPASTLVARGATAPATTTTPTWAGNLATQATGDFVASLAQSAASKLIAAGTSVSLTGRNSVSIPRRAVQPAALLQGWVAEGDPAPAPQYGLTNTLLGPTRKLLLLVAMTRETVEVGGEQVVMTLLRETAAATLDATLFGSGTATTARPAGLLNGNSALTATAGGGENAMISDLEKLAGAVAAGGGSGQVAYIAAPAQAASAALRLGTNREQVVWTSAVLAAGTIVALDPSGFVSAFDPEPDISASRSTAVVMDDTAPAQVGTPGTPNTVGAPAMSSYQIDVIVLRLRLRAAYMMRQPGLVSYVTGATWGAQS